MAARSCSWIATVRTRRLSSQPTAARPPAEFSRPSSVAPFGPRARSTRGQDLGHRSGATGFFVADRTHSRLNAVDTSAAEPLGLLEPDVIRNISWNPAGTALIVEALSDGVPTLWRVPVEPVSLRWGTPERLTTAPASAEGAAVSPDGTRVTFTSAQASSRAWLFPFDANSAQLMGNGQALTAEDLVLVSLSLARDGAALCYGARQAGRNQFQLFSHRPDDRRHDVGRRSMRGRDFPNRAQGGLSTNPHRIELHGGKPLRRP